MISWQKDRDPVTTQLVHRMYDGSTAVAVVQSCKYPGARFRVKVRDATPWHRRDLKTAKSDCEFVYINCKRK